MYIYICIYILYIYIVYPKSVTVTKQAFTSINKSPVYPKSVTVTKLAFTSINKSPV